MTQTNNFYESDRCLAEYLLFHYGQARDLCPLPFIPAEVLQFHQRIRQECVLPLPFPGPTFALDAGCGVGRFAFELGLVADRVLGLDSCQAFIEAARRMAQAHGLTLSVKESGAGFGSLELALPSALHRSVVEFQTGDAQDLSAFADRSFHLVAAINLICRLPRPRQFLSQLHRLIVPGGQLILASPFSWLEEFSPPAQWFTGGAMEELLQPHFRLAVRRDLPFVIREHRRKYQLVLSQVSVFVRRN